MSRNRTTSPRPGFGVEDPLSTGIGGGGSDGGALPPVSTDIVAVSAARGPATSRVYDLPASRVTGRRTSAADAPLAWTSAVALPDSIATGCDAAVRPTPCATVLPFTSRSSVPASGEA